MSAIDAALERNAAYAERFDRGGLGAPPRLGLAVVTCMDARLETGRLLGLAEGDAHVIRNAGGVVTEDVIRSLTISQRLLDTREVMVVQHTDCGMTSFGEEELRERIREETGLRPPFALEAFPEVEAEVQQSLARVRSSPFLPYREAVRGFVYEVESGRLREVA